MEGGRGRRRQGGGREGGCSECTAGWDAPSRMETLLPTKAATNVSSCKIKVRGRRGACKYN